MKYTESIPPLTLLLRCPQKVHHLFSKAPDIRPSPVDEASTAFTQVCRPGELKAIGETPPCHSPIKDIASSSTPIPFRRQIGLPDYFIELFFFYLLHYHKKTQNLISVHYNSIEILGYPGFTMEKKQPNPS